MREMKLYLLILLILTSSINTLKLQPVPNVEVEASLVLNTKTVKLGHPSLKRILGKDDLELDYTGLGTPMLKKDQAISHAFGLKSNLHCLKFPIIKMNKAVFIDPETLGIRFLSNNYLVLKFRAPSDLKQSLSNYVNIHLNTEHLAELKKTRLNLKELLKRFNNLNKYIKKHR
jgi:hypothetical protein